MQLCRGYGGGFRQCIMTALPKLSDPCRKAIGERAAASHPPAPGTNEYRLWRRSQAAARPGQAGQRGQGAGAAVRPWRRLVDRRQGPCGGRQGALGQFGKGWAFASANYRLVPQATVEQQAADVASAIAWLRANAAKEGLDPDRIVLMGHSAGAHLVALVGTDPHYLKAAGVPMGAVKGVVLLDGAGYDVAGAGRAPG